MMGGPTAEQLKEWNRERLDLWAARMLQENSTPVLLLGVGHGAKSGQLTVCIPQEIPAETIELVVAFLYRELVERGRLG